MANIGKALSFLGGHGPVLLVASLVCGALVPPLAHAGHVALPLAAFLMVLGSLLTAILSPVESRVSTALVGSSVIWVGLAVPFLVAVGLAWVDPPPALRFGIILSILAPPTGSAAAVAAMLNLRPRLALVGSMTLTVAAPLTMPLLAAAIGLGISFDTMALTYRLAFIVGTALVVALAYWRHREACQGIVPSARAASGIAVIGLVIVGLATASGLSAEWHRDPDRILLLLAAATVLNVVACAISAALFAPFGTRIALTVGLVSGNRNVTLAWAAAGLSLPMEAESYVAASVVPILALPLVIKAITGMSWTRRRPVVAR